MSRVNTTQLTAIQSNTNHIRNICIIAHVDHGKTTLSDSLVSSNGLISDKLAGKIRFLDNTEEEQLRGITMKSSAISLLYNGPPTLKEKSELKKTNPDISENYTVPYLINLVDSPGHVDFSFDVSTAVRLCDGALVLIDVVEGVCAQTHAVLRQAWQEGIRPCLILNKIDRLIYELQYTPYEAYQHISRIVEQANVIISSMIRADTLVDDEPSSSNNAQNDISDQQALVEDEDEDFMEDMERAFLFEPSRGNVLFASAVDGWAFNIGYFANYYAKKLQLPLNTLRRALWGEYYLNKKTLKITTKSTGQNSPMFVTCILNVLWSVYKTMKQPIESPSDLENVRNLTKQLRVSKLLSDRELKHADRKIALQNVMRRWLSLSNSVLKMVTRMLPSPIAAQQKRAERLCSVNAENSLQLNTFSSIQNCQSEGTCVIYICKVISVEKNMLSDYVFSNEDNKNEEVYVAIGRVFAGTFQSNSTMYVFGPKYNCLNAIDDDISKSAHITRIDANTLKSYLVMGREFVSVANVPAGNIIGIVGLNEQVLKTATLSSSIHCPSLTTMPYQAKPIVRVAVEPVDPRHFTELEAGLQRLYRSDPTVEVHVQESGEHVIIALGELHLERCIKDLKDRFAKVPIYVSEPLIGFKETIVEGSISSAQEKDVFKDILSEHTSITMTEVSVENEGNDSEHKCISMYTPDRSITFQVRACPVPAPLIKYIEDHQEELRQITNSTVATSSAPVTPANHLDTITQVKEQVEQLLQSEQIKSEYWKSLSVDQMWCLGPRRIGPNILINNIANFTPQTSIFSNSTVGLSKLNISNATTTTTPSEAIERMEMLKKLEHSIITGFQLATTSGPLCDEPVYGVAFILENIQFNSLSTSNIDKDGGNTNTTETSSSSTTAGITYGPITGQVISTMKNICRNAFLQQPVRLVEAIYTCTVQCQAEQLGKLYSVIAKRRGIVFQEILTDGSSLFTIHAYIPVVESFGFATELLKNTSGAASNPQLVFSHWLVMEEDPFFQPSTEEEREDYGERVYEHNSVRKYIENVRKRKGLARDEKIVVHAEKQRTLGRKK